MNPIVKQMMLAGCLMLLPSLALAADPPVAAPAVEIKPAVTLTQPTVAAAPKSPKIGYVDITRVGMESDFAKSVKTTLTDKKQKLETKVLAKRKQLDKLKQSIESKLSTFTPQQREAKTKEFQKKVEEFQKLAKESEEEFMKLQEAETAKIFTLIEKVVNDFGKQNAYEMIVVKKDMLYLGSGVAPQDVTEPVLKLVNEGWKKK